MNGPYAFPSPYAFPYTPGAYPAALPPDNHAIFHMIRHLEQRLDDAERRIAELERQLSALRELDAHPQRK
ncbi:MAG TPA: hypothetical protein VIK75_09610 [Calditerricola sp.]